MGGPTVFNGYYNHDNEGVFSKEGLFRTGDLVEITGEDGRYLKIVGRCKEMINRGGFKLSPVELDLLLEKIDGVKEAAAFSIPDDTLGERVGAAIVLEDPAKPIDLEAISAYFESQGVAKFKTPEGVIIIEALPRNPVGKVQRFVLNEVYQAQNV
jgi:non-ribosomal peptide synthetase component E (peptide arylation enzyme)